MLRLRKLLLLLFSHNSHSQVRGYRTGSSHAGAEEYPGENTQTNQKWYTRISQMTPFVPPPEKYKNVKLGVSLRCARSILVHSLTTRA